MFTLIISVALGFAFAFFATQNTSSVTLTLGNILVPNVPVYLVVLSALLGGLFIAGLVSLVQEMSSSFTISGQEHEIKRARSVIAKLQERVHELEVQNSEIRGEAQVIQTEQPAPIHHMRDHFAHQRPNFFDRLRQRLSL